jgi:hypothetical protein
MPRNFFGGSFWAADYLTGISAQGEQTEPPVVEPAIESHGYLREFGTLFLPTRKRVKKLQHEAREIIERAKDVEPQEAAQLFDESAAISKQLQEAIAAFEQAAAGYQQRLNEQAQQRATAQARELQFLLIQAQLQVELMQQQVEELDVCYVMMMMAAHV